MFINLFDMFLFKWIFVDFKRFIFYNKWIYYIEIKCRCLIFKNSLCWIYLRRWGCIFWLIIGRFIKENNLVEIKFIGGDVYLILFMVGIVKNYV